MSVLLGLHKFVIYYDSQDDLITKKDVEDYLNFSFVKTNFDMNENELEPFEPPKILGDVFESVMGAILEDGGLDAVMRVYRHLLCPMILFVAKFSKDVHKEPKEQFVIKATTDFRIKPKFRVTEHPETREVVGKVMETFENEDGQIEERPITT